MLDEPQLEGTQELAGAGAPEKHKKKHKKDKDKKEKKEKKSKVNVQEFACLFVLQECTKA